MNEMIVSTVNFSKKTEVKDAVRHLVELAKHQQFDENPKEFDHYAQFSTGGSYKEKLELVFSEIEDVVATTLGLDVDKMKEINPELHMFSNSNARDLFLSVVAKATDEMNIAVDLGRAMPFMEIHNLADGDSNIFHIGSKNIIDFEKNSNGRRNARINQVFSRDITVTPENRKGTVAVDMYKLSARTEDLGRLVNKITRGMRLAMSQEVVDLLFETASPSVNAVYLSTFAQTTFQEGLETIESLNGSENLMAFGVRSALAPVLPTNDNLKFGLGTEIMKQGHISDLFGVPAVRLSQIAKTGSDKTNSNKVIPSDHIIVASLDTDTIVKNCMEGRTRFTQSKEGDTADDRLVYTVEAKWKIVIASPSHFLLVQTR